MDAGRTGIRFQNEVSDSLLLGNRNLGQGGGVCLGDVDGDGHVDVFLARTQGSNKLYRNLGDWRFEDITERAGVAAPDRFSTGCAFADVSGKGALDLILLATTGPNAVFVNDGHGRFTEHRDLGLDPRGNGGTTVTMADVDGDAWLDLYVANYKAYSVDDSIPPDQRRATQMVRRSGPGPTDYEVIPERRDEYRIVNRPDMGGLRLTQRGSPDEFYVNRGGRFERVAFTSGRFLDTAGRAIAQAPESFGLDAKFVDLNQDGAPDLYVANDFEDVDELWMNDGRGRFRLASWKSLRQMSNAAMGIDAGDINGDGLPDLFVVDMLANDRRHLKTQIPTHTAFPKKPGDAETQLQYQRNTLFLNRGDGTFAEVSAYAGLQASGWSWSTMFLDVDLDGWQDILVANGHLWDIMDADTQERLQREPPDPNWQRLRWKFPQLRLSNIAWRNRGDLTFENASERWNFDAGPDISHAIAAGDLDGDGDLDVVVNRLGAPALVLRNDAAAPRIAVRLVGDAPNTRAVGARVRLLGGAIRVQEREVVVGGLYLSHSDYLTTFAMGSADSAMLVIEWRDGRRTTMKVRPNRMYEVTTATAQRTKNDSTASVRATLFDDASAMLRGHKHVEPPFDDWSRQYLLPNALSQLGPGLSWFDYDRDGDEDLLIGAGRGGRLAVFRNEGGRLVPQSNQGAIADADYTGILGFNGNLSSHILAGISSWEGQSVPAVIGIAVGDAGRAVATRVDTVVPPFGVSSGPLALGDYNGDGSPDLFVGGRVIPGAYPRRASSALLRYESGRFVLDSANATRLRDVGLVSAAMFADINGDGHSDLVLARDWDSILLLLNDGRGHLSRAPDSWGLSRWTSRWNGIAAGDLDGDGRLDLVATSWGRNTATPADSARPLVMFYGAFGQAREEEVLLARQDASEKRLFPLNSYGRLRYVLPDLQNRVNSFGSYADASVETVLGPRMREVQRSEAITLDHMAFLNRGDHFEATALPAEAQFAPAFGVIVADFDGDGFEDVFLAQNFSATAVGLPRYDAGRGLLLRGDGSGGLTPVRGQDSGVLIYGDQRGTAAADFDHDGRLDLVVSENAGATRLLHNRGAKPGLRVHLVGPPSNPDAVGAQVRVVYGDRLGPVREIQTGSGYWSQNAAVQVFGLARTPTAVWVRWPGGTQGRVPISAGTRELTLRFQEFGSR